MSEKKVRKDKILCKINKLKKKVYYGVPNFFHYLLSLLHIAKNRKIIKIKINRQEVLNVVFIIQYIPGWNKLEPIYANMKSSDKYNPIIVCIPSDSVINSNNEIDKFNDTYNYFIENGYSAINAAEDNNEWYDLRRLEPDYVFHSRPYNQFLPKVYSSGIVSKYSLICNVLYGASITENGQNVVFNKNYFSDVYCYFSFDKSEKKFYEKRFWIGSKLKIQKCFPYGAIGVEQILKAKLDFKDQDFRKSVLWTPRWSTDRYIGGSNFFEFKDTIFDLARRNQDILFVLRPHPLMFSNFIKTAEMTEREVTDFKKYCEQEKNIILDESKEYSDQFWRSDFLITDASGILPEYFITGKPIIYCHSNASFVYTEYASRIIESCYEVNSLHDLIRYFNDLLIDKDSKCSVRQKCINEYFSCVQNNSKLVLDALDM